MEEKTKSSSQWLKYLLIIIVVGSILAVFAFINLIGTIAQIATTMSANNVKERVLEYESKDKIALIRIEGVLSSATTPFYIDALKKAEKDDNVKGIVLFINSPGGEVTATDEVYYHMQRIRKKKKIVTYMSSIAASGGYYLAVGTDHIIANKNTLTGSIGVIIGGYNFAKAAEKLGISSVVIASGENKSILNPLEEVKQRDIDLLKALIDETYGEFAAIVSENRKIDKAKFFAKDSIYADARIFSGKQAKEANLVDQLGYLDDAYAKVKELNGLKKATIVEYPREKGLVESILYGKVNISTTSKIIDEAFNLKANRMYYIMGTSIQ